MRDIKLRAWDKQDKRMIVDKQDFIPLIVTNKSVFKLDPTSEKDRWIEIDTNRFELMQYTGLKDKNGVQIYDGDIVRKLNGNYKLGKVVFQFGMFCFESFGCGIYEGSDAFLHIHSLHYKEYNSENNYEVIGNIYEHQHLLGGE